MIVYHYTSFNRIGGILGKFRGEPGGLQPRRRIGLQFPPFDNPSAAFGLLEPTPDNWVTNQNFPLTWRALVHDLRVMGDGALLVEAQVDAKNDRAFVGERGHLEGFLYTDKTTIPKHLLHPTATDSEKAFMGSLIPLDEYLERAQINDIKYSLPEVVILETVPPERVVVSTQQPLLEEELATTFQEQRDYLHRLIKDRYAAEELAPWKRSYETKRGPLELRPRTRERL